MLLQTFCMTQFLQQSSLSSSFEHPDKLKVLRAFKPYILLGRLASFLQSFRFNKTRLSRTPTDWSVSRNFVQPSRISFSRFRTSLKLVSCKIEGVTEIQWRSHMVSKGGICPLNFFFQHIFILKYTIAPLNFFFHILEY